MIEGRRFNIKSSVFLYWIHYELDKCIVKISK